MLLQLAVLTLLMVSSQGRLLVAAEPAALENTQQFAVKFRAPDANQDDASLRCVTGVGKTFWAAGDFGVLWKSTDYGASWKFLALPSELKSCSFHSLYFMTDKIGWMAGGLVLPAGGVPVGIVLHTTDGGENWTLSRKQSLPYLKHIQFSTQTDGLAVGDRSLNFPSGVLQTSDGGMTWSPIKSDQIGRWNTASFYGDSLGVIGGPQSQQATLGQQGLRRSLSQWNSLPAWQGSSMDHLGQAWMVGDGANIARSKNFGVSWESYREELPSQLQDFTNFSDVTHRDDHVWVVGSPGSVVWHSQDGGKHWLPQKTGHSTPLRAIHFFNSDYGVAVGELGRICITHNGGQTWENVRGNGLRVAVLAMQTHTDQTAIPFLTRYSKEEGYRSALMIAVRGDVGSDAHAAAQIDDKLAHAIQSSGGTSGWIDWRLPVSIPHLAADRERLLEEWSQLTDRRLSDVLLAAFVGEIRTWRPSVILIDEPNSTEYTAELLQFAVNRAVELAADPKFSLPQTEIAGLEPWQVSKVVMQRSGDIQGTIRLDRFDILGGQNATLETSMSTAIRQLQRVENRYIPRYEFKISEAASDPKLSTRNIFGDLALAPGGEARRKQPPIHQIDMDKLLTQTNHRRIMTAAAIRSLQLQAAEGEMIAQIDRITKPLSPEQSAAQLYELGQLYLAQGSWGSTETVYCELITRYPQQPLAADAMVWLLKFWGSGEVSWQRVRTMSERQTQTTQKSFTQEDLEAAVQTVIDRSRKPSIGAVLPASATVGQVNASITTETPAFIGNFSAIVNAGGSQVSGRELSQSRWLLAALAVSESLEQGYPQLFDQPDVRFLVASLNRRRGNPKRAEELNTAFLQTLNNDPWSLAAQGEASLLIPNRNAAKSLVLCRKTPTPPILDGLLSDPCWISATEIRLTLEGNSPKPQSDASSPVILMSRDDRFLYLAGTVPIDPTLPNDPPDLAGRDHDSDLSRFDRISIQLDTDRDYNSFYEFEIDQRGHTRDACWGNINYDPQWFCAVERSSDAWRFECAIPLEELVPPESLSGKAWGVGLSRIRPGRPAESWTSSGALKPNPALFGLVRFQ